MVQSCSVLSGAPLWCKFPTCTYFPCKLETCTTEERHPALNHAPFQHGRADDSLPSPLVTPSGGARGPSLTGKAIQLRMKDETTNTPAPEPRPSAEPTEP